MAMPHSLESKDTQDGEFNDTNVKGNIQNSQKEFRRVD